MGLTLKTIMKTLPENHHAQQKMVKNANFLSFIREKNTRLAPRILTIQVKLGVQHEQTGNLLRGTVNWSVSQKSTHINKGCNSHYLD